MEITCHKSDRIISFDNSNTARFKCVIKNYVGSLHNLFRKAKQVSMKIISHVEIHNKTYTDYISNDETSNYNTWCKDIYLNICSSFPESVDIYHTDNSKCTIELSKRAIDFWEVTNVILKYKKINIFKRHYFCEVDGRYWVENNVVVKLTKVGKSAVMIVALKDDRLHHLSCILNTKIEENWHYLCSFCNNIIDEILVEEDFRKEISEKIEDSVRNKFARNL